MTGFERIQEPPILGVHRYALEIRERRFLFIRMISLDELFVDILVRANG